MAKKNNTQVNSDMNMKIFVFVALLVAFGLGMFVARARYKPQLEILTKMNLDKDAALQQMKSNYNKVMMKDDKMMVVENGVASPMEQEVVLQSGDKVTTEGEIVKADGTKTKLQNGDAVDLTGKVMTANSADTNQTGF